MLKLRINPIVAKDLKNIRDYIAEDNEEYAAKTIKKIYGKFENLQMFPGMGSDLSKRVSFRTDYKYAIWEDYVIIYKIGKEYVEVYCVVNRYQDITRMANGYFANIRNEIPTRLREVIVRLEKIFWKLLRENFRKKQVPYSLILSQYVFIPLRVRIV
jgi:toxin ParE1/3/4